MMKEVKIMQQHKNKDFLHTLEEYNAQITSPENNSINDYEIITANCEEICECGNCLCDAGCC
jgi:hypothetical protein